MLVRKAFEQCLVLLTVFAYGAVGRPLTSAHNTTLAVDQVQHIKDQTSEGAVDQLPTKKTTPIGLPFPYKLKRLTIPQGAHVSPLAYRKAFKIHFPLKPKLFKHIHYLHKKNLAAKRDTKNNFFFQSKHVPFIKSFTMLLDDVLHTGENLPDSAGDEDTFRPIVTSKTDKSDRKSLPNQLDLVSANSIKRDSKDMDERKGKFNSKKDKEATYPENSTTEQSSYSADTKTTPADILTDENGSLNIAAYGSGTSVSILPTSNSTASLRHDDGHFNGSSTPINSDLQGVFAEYSGNVERISSVRDATDISDVISEHSNGTSRNSTGGNFADPRRGEDPGNAITRLRFRGNSDGHAKSYSTQCPPTLRELIEQHKIKNKIKNRRDSLQVGKRFGNRLRGPHAKFEENTDESSVQPGSFIRESIKSNSDPDSDYHRHIGGNSANTFQLFNAINLQKINKVIGTTTENTTTADSQIIEEYHNNEQGNVTTQKEYSNDQETSTEDIELSESTSTGNPLLNENETCTPMVTVSDDRKSFERKYIDIGDIEFSLNNDAKITAPFSKPIEIISGYSNYHVVDSKTKA